MLRNSTGVFALVTEAVQEEEIARHEKNVKDLLKNGLWGRAQDERDEARDEFAATGGPLRVANGSVSGIRNAHAHPGGGWLEDERVALEAVRRACRSHEFRKQ